MASVTVYYPFGDGKAEAGAAGFAVAGIVGAVEAFEDFREVFRCYADSGVLNFEYRNALFIGVG